MFAGSTINPFVPPIDSRVIQLKKKIDAGAEFIQTQYCFDLPMMNEFMSQAVDMGLTERAFILPGVGTLASANTARWLKKNVPGVHIPDSIIKRLDGADDQQKEGRKICTEFMQQVKEIDGVSGVHIMAYKQEQHVAKMVKDSGVLGDRKPWAPKNEY
jgi:5,10-methylenetetrahydrofolate reductase